MNNIRYVIVRVEASNDLAGNPQRAWLVNDLSTGARLFVDEGYKGWPALDAVTGKDNTARRVVAYLEITTREYRRLKSSYTAHESS